MIEVLYSISILHLYFTDDPCLPQEMPELDEVPESQGNTKTFKIKTHIFQEDKRKSFMVLQHANVQNSLPTVVKKHGKCPLVNKNFTSEKGEKHGYWIT
jgi:hypothetical protein